MSITVVEQLVIGKRRGVWTYHRVNRDALAAASRLLAVEPVASAACSPGWKSDQTPSTERYADTIGPAARMASRAPASMKGPNGMAVLRPPR